MCQEWRRGWGWGRAWDVSGPGRAAPAGPVGFVVAGLRLCTVWWGRDVLAPGHIPRWGAAPGASGAAEGEDGGAGTGAYAVLVGQGPDPGQCRLDHAGPGLVVDRPGPGLRPGLDEVRLGARLTGRPGSSIRATSSNPADSATGTTVSGASSRRSVPTRSCIRSSTSKTSPSTGPAGKPVAASVPPGRSPVGSRPIPPRAGSVHRGEPVTARRRVGSRGAPGHGQPGRTRGEPVTARRRAGRRPGAPTSPGAAVAGRRG